LETNQSLLLAEIVRQQLINQLGAHQIRNIFIPLEMLGLWTFGLKEQTFTMFKIGVIKTGRILLAMVLIVDFVISECAKVNQGSAGIID
jgi:hypothetical protein